MTKFEIRYGTRSIEVERDNKFEGFLNYLSSLKWLIIDDDGVNLAIQVCQINSVKVVK